ncbi:hypothetical protein F4604DRAFT_1825207, partial [Suillus subluteus]
RSPVVKVRLKLLQEFPTFVHRLVADVALCCYCERLIGGFREGGVHCEYRARHYHAGFGTSQYAFFQARVQKVYMILQKLHPLVRFKNLERRETQERNSQSLLLGLGVVGHGTPTATFECEGVNRLFGMSKDGSAKALRIYLAWASYHVAILVCLFIWYALAFLTADNPAYVDAFE